MGHKMTLNYKIKNSSFSPKAITVNGEVITFLYQENKYRLGGAVININEFLAMLNKKENVVEISL
jgi:hypothetical protein